MATKNLPAKVSSYTALQAISTFNEAEKKVYKEMSDYVNKFAKDSIWWYWELGQKVSAVQDAAKSLKGGEKTSIYGKNIVERLAKALGYGDRMLYNAAQVVRVFGTKKAFTEYVKLKGEAGNTLQWSHMVYLSGIADADMRLQLAATSLEQCWTAEDLFTRVKELCNRKKRGSGKRTAPKTKIPSSVKNYLSNVAGQAQKFIYNFDNAWSGDAFDLNSGIEEIPVDRLDDKLLTALDDTRLLVGKMRERAQLLEDAIDEAEATIAERMEAREKLAEELAAAEEAESREVVGEEEPSEEELAALEEDASDAPEYENLIDDDEEEEEAEEEEDDGEEDSINLGELQAQRRREAMERVRARSKRGKAGVK